VGAWIELAYVACEGVFCDGGVVACCGWGGVGGGCWCCC